MYAHANLQVGARSAKSMNTIIPYGWEIPSAATVKALKAKEAECTDPDEKADLHRQVRWSEDLALRLESKEGKATIERFVRLKRIQKDKPLPLNKKPAELLDELDSERKAKEAAEKRNAVLEARLAKYEAAGNEKAAGDYKKAIKDQKASQ